MIMIIIVTTIFKIIVVVVTIIINIHVKKRLLNCVCSITEDNFTWKFAAGHQ